MLERFLEEFNGVNENRFLRLLLNYKVENFKAEICARACRQMEIVDEFLVFLLNVVLVDVDHG